MNEPKPIIASVGAVIFKQNDVLLIKRAKPPFKHHWSIPGGKIEYGETVQSALHREIKEETGIEINIIGLIDIFESLPEIPGETHFLMIDYVGEWVRGEVVAGDDAEEAEFVPFAEALSRLAWDKTRRALQQAKSAIHRARLAN
ncbi:MAG: NUDIX hydrolase [bacterium]